MCEKERDRERKRERERERESEKERERTSVEFFAFFPPHPEKNIDSFEQSVLQLSTSNMTNSDQRKATTVSAPRSALRDGH